MSTGFDRDRGEFTRGARTVIVLPDQGDAVRDAEARLEPHRRRLAEVERLAADGLLAEVELKAARAEAGRSLLAAADQAQVWTPDGAGARKAVVLAVGLGIFEVFRRRFAKAWGHAQEEIEAEIKRRETA